jgi:putative ABC transport system permease protein
MSDNEVLVLRGSADLAMLTPVIRRIVASVDPEVPTGKITTVNRLIAERFTSRKTGMLLVAVFSATALFLSAIGIYGMLAYTVIQRTREVGIRVSLGATSIAILRLILRDGLQIVGIGLILGVIVAESANHLIQSALFGVSANDPIALGAGVMVLASAAFAACFLPALRASRISPITALRE